MIAVYTYYPLKSQEACGFLNTNDLAMFLSLSVEYSKKQFRTVKLMTNKYGKSILIDKYKIAFTEVSTKLEGLKFPKELWAYSKIISYSLQQESFIHIDNDVILWEKLPREIKLAPIAFQHKELFETETGYAPLIKELCKTTVSYFLKSQKVNYALNCGIVAVNDLPITKKWKELVDEFISNGRHVHRARFNYIFEQYFIACILKNEGIEAKFLLNEKDSISKPKFKMTHLWGETKKSPDIEKIKARLKKEFPKIFARIDKIQKNELQVFDVAIKKFPNKPLLKKTIKDFNVKSIVYLTFDNQHSKLLTLDGKTIDFLYTAKTYNSFPECDLLIIGDGFPTLKGDVFYKFFSRHIPAKHILQNKKLIKGNL